jgi:hypothetical protein
VIGTEFNRPLSGFGTYVHGWHGDEDLDHTDFVIALLYRDEDDTAQSSQACPAGCAIGRSELERSLIEAGLRFFHDFGAAPQLNGISLGIEPFVALIEEDAYSAVGEPASGDHSSDLDSTAFGGLLELDGRYHISSRTTLTGRVAAGAYHMDADADAQHRFISSTTFNDELSSEFFGFRGQLALGLEQALTDSVSFGVIGRLDYCRTFRLSSGRLAVVIRVT